MVMSNTCHNWTGLKSYKTPRGNSHTWEYWGCTAGHGAIFELQAFAQGVFFDLPELAKGAFLRFQLNLSPVLSCFLLISQVNSAEFHQYFFSFTLDISQLFFQLGQGVF